MRIVRARWWIAAAAVATIVFGARAWHHLFYPPMLHAGDRLAPIALSSLSGNEYTLQPDGRPQLIHIFATWCGPCRSEMQQFAALARRLHAQGVDVVAIDQQESAGRVTAFAREFHLTFPIYIDTSGITHAVLGARVIPATIYVDGGGIIRWKHLGPMEVRSDA